VACLRRDVEVAILEHDRRGGARGHGGGQEGVPDQAGRRPGHGQPGEPRRHPAPLRGGGGFRGLGAIPDLRRGDQGALGGFLGKAEFHAVDGFAGGGHEAGLLASVLGWRGGHGADRSHTSPVYPIQGRPRVNRWLGGRQDRSLG
jgi:hypothetical protein